MTSRIDDLFSVSVPKTLYHYTNASGLLGILSSQTMWTTKIYYLNDKQELSLAFEIIREEITNQRRRNPRIRTDEDLGNMEDLLFIFSKINLSVASFSEHGDQLSQWRGYCDVGNGYTIGFNGEMLRNHASKSGYLLAPCEYREEVQRLIAREIVEDGKPIDLTNLSEELRESILRKKRSGEKSFIDLLLGIAPLIKHSSFSEEKEWRLINTGVNLYNHAKFRVGRNYLVPYWEFSLTDSKQELTLGAILEQIVIGPTNEPELLKEAVRGLLIAHGLDSTEIVDSSVPCRDW